MEICSLPSFLPFFKSILAIAAMVTAIIFLTVWIKYGRRYATREPMILKQGSIWRSFIRLNQHKWVMTSSFAIIAFGCALITNQISKSDPCFISPYSFDAVEFIAVFLTTYILVGMKQSQGIGCYLDDDVKVTWDHGDVLSLHLAGKPRQVLRTLKSDMIERIDQYARTFEAAGLPSTIRLESWLFLRLNNTATSAELTELHHLISFPNLAGQLVRLEDQSKGFWNKICHTFVKYRIMIKLFIRAKKISRALYKMTMPELDKLSHSLSEAPTTRTISKVLKELKALDPDRSVNLLPIRKLTTWETINLVASYPTIGSRLFPWTTGFQITK